MQVIVTVEALNGPIADVLVDARCLSTAGGSGDRAYEALRVVKPVVGDIGDGEVRGIDGRDIAAAGLEDDELEAVDARFSGAIGGVEVAGVVPPLGEIVVRALILRETDGRQDLRG